LVGLSWLIVVACAVGVAGIKLSSLSAPLPTSLSCGFPPLLPTVLDWVQRPLAVGVGLHGLSPTPGIPVGCRCWCTDGHVDTVGHLVTAGDYPVLSLFSVDPYRLLGVAY
jgi:hypothetical protein